MIIPKTYPITETGFHYIQIKDANGMTITVKESRNYNGLILIPEDDPNPHIKPTRIVLTSENIKEINMLSDYLQKNIQIERR